MVFSLTAQISKVMLLYAFVVAMGDNMEKLGDVRSPYYSHHNHFSHTAPLLIQMMALVAVLMQDPISCAARLRRQALQPNWIRTIVQVSIIITIIIIRSQRF